MNGMDLSLVASVMKWPLVACLVLPPLLVYMGLHVVEREVIFVDLALAQVATFGTSLALLLGYDAHDRITFWISLAVTFMAAGLFSWSRTRRGSDVPQEAIIGITFVVAAAAVILLLSRVAGGREELENLLTGDILNVTAGEVGQRVLLFAVVAGFFGALHKSFALISEDVEDAYAQGLRVGLLDFLFYSAFAVIVVSFVRVAGVLLTFTYLIVPAVCGATLTRSWRGRLTIGWVVAFTGSIIGMVTSYLMDLPTGAAIVCACGLLLVLVSVIGSMRSA